MPVKIILGPPGCGKTTRLLNLVEDHLKAGVRPEAIGFISFTKKAVAEALERATKRFQYNKNNFQYFRTIHSLAFKQLRLLKRDVMQPLQYHDFGRKIGLRVSGVKKEVSIINELGKGDQALFIDSLAKLSCKSLKDVYDNSQSDLTWYEVEFVSQSFKKYKQINCLIDYTDMLVRYNNEGIAPKLEVLFIDEAQDLSTLQWEIVKRLIASSKNTYIAGDDDQAIFRWSGADVDYFLKMCKENESEVLKQSFRLPISVHTLANNLSKTIKNRKEKEFSPINEQGNVKFVGNLDEVELNKGPWLILVRNGYLINDVVDYCKLCGYPYETNYENPKNSPALRAAMNWERFKTGILPEGNELENIKEHISNCTHDKFNSLMAANTIWHEALDKITESDREYFISVRRNGESLTIGEPRIRISTIHSAKGGECENVLLYVDMSKRTYNGMLENYDDETRVFYVGATRAKKNLVIMSPQSQFFYQI